VNTTVSFEEQPVFVEDMTQRLDEVHSASLPWLVVEVNEGLLGLSSERWSMPAPNAK
jgi:L-amino acid N-acyltransferase YncA